MKNLELIDTLTSSVEDVKKYVFKYDEDILEVSYIRKNDGKDILCVPVQTSCNLGCTFCFLTTMGIKTKNLSAHKITSLIDECIKLQPPANPTLLISFMGSGESLMNIENVLDAASKIRKYKGYSNVRFGVSTILPGRSRFKRFKEIVMKEKLPVKLHWSLHSLDAVSRKNLMPNASNIQDSLKMVEEYMGDTKNPAEIHYTLIDEVNDRQEDLDKFIKYVGKKATIKFLKFAEKEGELMKGSTRVDWFRKELENNGFNVEVYSPPGRDIKSSCGQFVIDQYTK
jgi:23S rRNA (adenine2503-C2)-methyltransferase